MTTQTMTQTAPYTELSPHAQSYRNGKAVLTWKPIETAPKDGTNILVYKDVASVPVVHIAWYRSKDEWEKSGQYCGGLDTLEEWEGWWSYTENSVSQSKLVDYKLPSHWMELPDDPKN